MEGSGLWQVGCRPRQWMTLYDAMTSLPATFTVDPARALRAWWMATNLAIVTIGKLMRYPGVDSMKKKRTMKKLQYGTCQECGMHGGGRGGHKRDDDPGTPWAPVPLGLALPCEVQCVALN